MNKLLSMLLLVLISAYEWTMEFAPTGQVRNKLEEMYNNGRMTPGVITVTRTIKTVYPDGCSTWRKIPYQEQVANVEGLRINIQDLAPLLYRYITELHLQPLAEQIEIEHAPNPHEKPNKYAQPQEAAHHR